MDDRQRDWKGSVAPTDETPETEILVWEMPLDPEFDDAVLWVRSFQDERHACEAVKVIVDLGIRLVPVFVKKV